MNVCGECLLPSDETLVACHWCADVQKYCSYECHLAHMQREKCRLNTNLTHVNENIPDVYFGYDMPVGFLKLLKKFRNATVPVCMVCADKNKYQLRRYNNAILCLNCHEKYVKNGSIDKIKAMFCPPKKAEEEDDDRRFEEYFKTMHYGRSERRRRQIANIEKPVREPNVAPVETENDVDDDFIKGLE